MKDIICEARELLEEEWKRAEGELEQERDAELEQERAAREKAEGERDAALERVRVLERVAKDMLESTEWTVTGLVQAADVELVLAGLPPYDLDELRRQYEAKNEAPMFDWKAKITRLLELPGLTEEQKGQIKDAASYVTWTSKPDGQRALEQPMRYVLERLIEARGHGLTTQSDSQQRTQRDLHRAEIWMNRVDSWGVQSIATRGGETPAQALCDAILATFEEAPHD